MHSNVNQLTNINRSKFIQIKIFQDTLTLYLKDTQLYIWPKTFDEYFVMFAIYMGIQKTGRERLRIDTELLFASVSFRASTWTKNWKFVRVCTICTSPYPYKNRPSYRKIVLNRTFVDALLTLYTLGKKLQWKCLLRL